MSHIIVKLSFSIPSVKTVFCFCCCFQNWSQGFPGGVDVSEVREVYLDLLKKGVQFPPSDAEAETAEQEVRGPSLTHVE